MPYVEALSDARTKPADFFNILLGADGGITKNRHARRERYGEQGIGGRGNIQGRTYSETLISFTIGIGRDQTVPEGDSGSQNLVFTVKLSQASTQTVKVNYGTADNSATAGRAVPDYIPTSGTLTFAPGVTTQTISVTVNGDSVAELNETFFINLSNPVGAGT